MSFVCRIALIGILAFGLCENHLIAADDDVDEVPRLPGLKASYQTDKHSVDRIDDRLAFWLDQDQAPSASIDPAQWDAEWSGMLETRQPGNYRFFAVVSGRFELTIDGRQVLVADSGDSPQPVKRTGEPIELPFGPTSLQAKFNKLPDRPAILRLFRQLPDEFEESILPSAFWHVSDAAPLEPQSGETADRRSQLISEKRCALCHSLSEGLSRNRTFEVRPSAPLSDLAHGLRPAWIRSWMRNHQTRAMNGGLKLFGEGETEELDRKIVETYLSTLATDQATPPASGNQTESPRLSDSSNPDQTRGRELFARSGCIACHLAPAEQAPAEQATQKSRLIPLENLSQKYQPGQLVLRLTGSVDNKPAVQKVTAGHQPKLNLQDLPSSDINALELFLLEQTPSSDSGQPDAKSDTSNISSQQILDRIHAFEKNDPQFGKTNSSLSRGDSPNKPPVAVLRLGRYLVRQRGCVNCHREGDERSTSTISFDDILQTPAQDILDKGCLSTTARAGVPDYDLTNDERAAIGRELAAVADPKLIYAAPREQLEVKLNRLRCTSCHERSGRPSEFAQRIGAFVSLGQDKTLRDISPPSLDGVGERLTKQWLRNVLIEHRRSRPWLDVKMPRYDPQDVEPLIDLLIRADGVDPHESPTSVPDAAAGELDGARLLIGRTGLNCVGCHDFGDHRATGVRAPNLVTAVDRLRFDWFRRWLHDPQAIAPGTRMPSAFQSGISALPKVLGGREDAQVPALWAYLGKSEGRVPPLLPTVLKNTDATLEPDSPYPTDRPILRHGFLPSDAGLKAIALGFPEGLHFAWNSESCRLTRVWSGQFVHHAGWEDSGKGDVSANAMSILGGIIWRDDDDQPFQFTRSSGEEIPIGASDFKFDECWTTRSSGGFAWHVNIDDQPVRLEAHLRPLPTLGKQAFRRYVTIANLPDGIDVSHRIDSGVVADQPTSPSEPPEWIRVNHGRHDWLILNRGSSQPANVHTQNASQKKQFGTKTASKNVLITIPASAERHQIAFDLIYLHVDQGIKPPGDWQNTLRREGDLP